MHKASLKRIFRQSVFLFGLCLPLMFSTQASAQIIHLSLCIDGSGSIGATNFDLQLEGTATAVQDVVPTDGTVELSAIVFSSTINPIDLDPGSASNSLIINSQVDKDNVEALILAEPYPTGLTNVQGCISQAMDQQGCGPAVLGGTPSCPDDGVTRIIDISTDGDPTANNYDSDGNGGCGTSAAGIIECQEDTVDAATQASNAGVDVINVIGVGTGPTVTNMQEWTFDNIGLTSTVGVQDGEVFDPANTDGGVNGYTVGNPEIGDRGYVVLVEDFTAYQPTINAKIFNELNVESDISVVKTADSATVSPGDTLTYTLAVSNNDDTDVPDVVVTDMLPPGVTFVSADDSPSTANVTCAEASGIVTCDITSLMGNTTIDIDVDVTVD